MLGNEVTHAGHADAKTKKNPSEYPNIMVNGVTKSFYLRFYLNYSVLNTSPNTTSLFAFRNYSIKAEFNLFFDHFSGICC